MKCIERKISQCILPLKKLIQRMSLSVKEEEQLPVTVKEFPVLYDKAAKGKDTGKAVTRGILSKKVFLEI